MFSYSDNVDKELKYNQHIPISSIDSHAPHPKEEGSSEKKQASKVWRISNGDTLETILMVPSHSVFCASKTQPKVMPTNHHGNGGSMVLRNKIATLLID